MNRRLLAIALLALGCTKTSDPSPGSQTHFLDACDGNCPSGLSCLCGVCTLACDDGDDAMCAEQAESATCSAALDAATCAGSGRVCDVECAEDGECGALGAGFACEDGRCRTRAGGSAGTGASAGAGAGGRAGAGAGAGTGAGGRGGAGAGGEPMPGTDGGGVMIDAGQAADAGGDAGGEVCTLPPEVGPCEALIMRWYYDVGEQGCRYFNYGGCMGNANNFETQAECLAACGGKLTGTGSCEVNGVVYPSGSSDIDDPGSCNTCGCEDGQLLCTDIACPEPGEAGTVYGTTCSQCGLAGGCAVTRTGCLPSCEDESDCLQTPGSGCVGGICQLFCI